MAAVKEPTLTPTERRLSRTFKKNDSINRDALQALLRHPGFAPTSAEEAAALKSAERRSDAPKLSPSSAEAPAPSVPSTAAVSSLPAVAVTAPAVPPPQERKPVPAPPPQAQPMPTSSRSVHSFSPVIASPAPKPSAATSAPTGASPTSPRVSRIMQVPLEKPLVAALPVAADRLPSEEHIPLRKSAPELTGGMTPINAPPAILAHATRLPRRNPSPQKACAALPSDAA